MLSVQMGIQWGINTRHQFSQAIHHALDARLGRCVIILYTIE